MANSKVKSSEKTVPFVINENPYDFIDSAEKGISVKTFDDVVHESGYNMNEVAQFVGITVRTIQNKRKKGIEIQKKDAEHVLKLKALFSRGNDIFGSNEEFKRWMDKPSFGLNNRTPKSMLDYISGIDLISRELTRIEFGDFS